MGDRRENERVVRRTLDAVNGRDVAELQACFHADVSWFETGRDNPLGGPYRGIGEVLTFLAARFEQSADTLAIDVHDVVAGDEHVVALVRLTGARGDRRLDDRSVFVVHVDDGLVREIWSYAEDQTGIDGFWG